MSEAGYGAREEVSYRDISAIKNGYGQGVKLMDAEIKLVFLEARDIQRDRRTSIREEAMKKDRV